MAIGWPFTGAKRAPTPSADTGRREQQRTQELADHRLRATNPFGRVEGLTRRDALGPPFFRTGRDPHDEGIALAVGAQCGPEGTHERQAHPSQLDLTNRGGRVVAIVGHRRIVASEITRAVCDALH